MIPPLVSIITVVYNAVETIESTINSVLNQTIDCYEFIIIDGGSNDGTANIIKKYESKITCWISEKDNGIYDAMNKGINLAKGDFIYFLGADDILYDSEVLSKFRNFANNKFQVLYGDVIFKNQKVKYDGKFNDIKIVTRNICHQSIFYPRSIFKSYVYNTNYKIFADYELNLKLFKSKLFKFKYIPLTVAIFNDLGSSGSRVSDEVFEQDRMHIIWTHFPFWIYLYRIVRNAISKMIN